MILRLCVVVLLAAPLASDVAAQSGTPPIKFWVFFADKQPEAARGSTPARIALAPRATERRRLRGSPARPSGVDVPVAPAYVDELRALGVEPIVVSRWFNAVSAVLTPEQAETVRALPFVRGIRPVARLTTEQGPPERITPEPVSPVRLIDYGPSQFQLDVINARLPIEDGFTGEGTIVGFLDTTFDFAHPALAQIELLAQENFTGQEQGSTHGLSVSSIAVGFDEGDLVGPGFGAAVLAATTEYAPSETHQEEDFFVAGMEWMETNGADVVNVSLGYSTFDVGEGDYTYDDMDGNTTLVTRAADIAASLGIAVVTSAGNEGSSSWHFITAPADADSVITVGAMRADSTRASFSSFGPTADGRTKPDVVALGVDVVHANANGGYGIGNGTSFSAPAVTGVVAQMLQANPTLNPIQVRDVLRATASQPDAPDNERGWGVVNAGAAVQQAIALATEDPGASPPVEAFLYPTLVPRDHRVVTMKLAGTEAPARVTLRLYDVLGRRIAMLYEGPPRLAPVTLALPSLSAGVYFYRFTGDDPSAGSGQTLDTGGRIVVQ